MNHEMSLQLTLTLALNRAFPRRREVKQQPSLLSAAERRGDVISRLIINETMAQL